MFNSEGVVSCIDWSEMNDDPRRLASSLEKAMATTGFIFIKNHERFFKEEIVQEKDRCAYSDNRGYTRVSQETLDPSKPDLDMKEGLNLGFISSTTPIRTVQPIPKLLQPHLPQLGQFQKNCFDFCQVLLRAFAVILGLEEEYFVKDHRHDEETKSILRFLHYPKIEDGGAASRNRAGAHSDYGSLTLLFQRSTGGEGLQILPSTEPLDSPNWQNVGSIPDALLVNIGDALELWSGARLKSTLHRVVLPEARESQAVEERFSIAFFDQPNPEASLLTVVPISDISENDLARMKAKGTAPGIDITAAEHLHARLDSTYKLK